MMRLWMLVAAMLILCKAESCQALQKINTTLSDPPQKRTGSILRPRREAPGFGIAETLRLYRGGAQSSSPESKNNASLRTMIRKALKPVLATFHLRRILLPEGLWRRPKSEFELGVLSGYSTAALSLEVLIILFVFGDTPLASLVESFLNGDTVAEGACGAQSSPNMSLATQLGTDVGTGAAYAVHYMGKVSTLRMPLKLVLSVVFLREKLGQRGLLWWPNNVDQLGYALGRLFACVSLEVLSTLFVFGDTLLASKVSSFLIDDMDEHRLHASTLRKSNNRHRRDFQGNNLPTDKGFGEGDNHDSLNPSRNG